MAVLSKLFTNIYQKTMPAVFVLTLVFLSSCTKSADNGPASSGKPVGRSSMGGMDSGGGDPLANEFIEIARAISHAIPETMNEDFGVTRQQFVAEIKRLVASLEGHNPLIVFDSDTSTVPCFGVDKLGCVREGRIHIARQGWKNATENEKFQVTAMELFLHMESPMRYEKAAVLAQKLTPTTVFGATFNPKTDCEGRQNCAAGIQGFYNLTAEYASEMVFDYLLVDWLVVEVGFTNRVCLSTRQIVIAKRQQPNLESLEQEKGPQSRFVAATLMNKWERYLPMIHFRVERVITVPFEHEQIEAKVLQLLNEGLAIRIRHKKNSETASIEILGGKNPDCSADFK